MRAFRSRGSRTAHIAAAVRLAAPLVGASADPVCRGTHARKIPEAVRFAAGRHGSVGRRKRGFRCRGTHARKIPEAVRFRGRAPRLPESLGVSAPGVSQGAREAPERLARAAADAASGYPTTPVTVVLFTCAGQRVDIVSAFGRAGATTVAADADALAPALYYAHRMALVPRVHDPGYVDALAALVAEHRVGIVVPLTDLDQEILSAARGDLAPALVLAPPPEVCRTTGDKYRAHVFFEAHGLASPRSWLPDDVPADARYPLLVKVREGFGSRHIYRAADPEQLAFFLAYTTVDSFVQEQCLGEEFSIDVFCDLDGRCVNAIPAHDDPVQGRRVDQGPVAPRSRADRARRPRGRDDRDRRPGEHPVLPRAGRQLCR